jgi:hypothetical protein
MHELREGGEVAVREPRVDGGQLPRDVGRVGDHAREGHAARIDLVLRGHGGAVDLHGMEGRVGERFAERSEFLARVRFHVCVHAGAAPRRVDRLTEEAREVVRVGETQREADISRRDAARAREHPHAERQAVLVAGRPGSTVLRARVPGFAHFETKVGVHEVRQPAARRVEQLFGDRRHAVDEVDAGHQNDSTSTSSPRATSPRSSSRITRQLPTVIERRMPEPCGPVVRTCHACSSGT